MVRIISTSSISLVLRSALLSLSKDARVSKDGHKRDRTRGHPSRPPREERGLLRMRSVDITETCTRSDGHDMTEGEVLHWIKELPLGAAVRESRWMFAMGETLHFIGLCLMAGRRLRCVLSFCGLVPPYPRSAR